jgi:selenocysteine lyase/cysteine desulfurase
LLAAIVSAEHAIGVRHGCFCAHPLMARLLDLSDEQVGRLHAELKAGGRPPLPGAVRASIGLGTTRADVDRLVGALDGIARRGPAAHYVHTAEHDEYRPLALAA